MTQDFRSAFFCIKSKEMSKTKEKSTEVYNMSNNENGENQNKDFADKMENIRETGAIRVVSKSSRIHTLVIAGQVEGHYELPSQTKSTKYEHVIPQLVEVEESDEVDGLLMILNTVGGDVEAGLAIAELVSGMTKPTVTLVIGGGHSIGVPLAVCAKKSFIAPSATMTIHPVRTNGLVIGVPQSFTYFLKMQERITDFVVKNSSVSDDMLNKLMLETDELAADIGTVIDGLQAVEIGLIDAVGGLGDALLALHQMIEKEKKDS